MGTARGCDKARIQVRVRVHYKLELLVNSPRPMNGPSSPGLMNS